MVEIRQTINQNFGNEETEKQRKDEQKEDQRAFFLFIFIFSCADEWSLLSKLPCRKLYFTGLLFVEGIVECKRSLILLLVRKHFCINLTKRVKQWCFLFFILYLVKKQICPTKNYFFTYSKSSAHNFVKTARVYVCVCFAASRMLTTTSLSLCLYATFVVVVVVFGCCWC